MKKTVKMMSDAVRKMNNHRKYAALVLMLVFAMLLSGCGSKKDSGKEESASIKANQITLYKVNGSTIEKDKDYLLKQPDSFNASIEELIVEMNAGSGISIVSYEPDEKNNITFFVTDKKERTPEELLLCSAATVRTFAQINGVGRITITFITEEGEMTDTRTYDPDSFFFYDHDEAYLNKDTITLYLPNSSGRKLKRVISDINISGDDSVEMAILKLLRDYDVISDDTEILSVFTRSGTCYIDFSEEFLRETGRNSNEVVIYSIVDSITNLRGINSVRIYIEGKDEKAFRGDIDITEILVFEGGILE